MAGIITISPGHDASYPWRQIGTADRARRTAVGRAGYYLSPRRRAASRPAAGRAGSRRLGFPRGAIDRQAGFRAALWAPPRPARPERAVPARPGAQRSARRRRSSRRARAEPDATAERRAQLLVEAKSQVRTPVHVLRRDVQRVEVHLAVARLRHGQRGCGSPAGTWKRARLGAGRRRRLGAHQAGNQAALEYLQREAGHTRSVSRAVPPGRPVGRRARIGGRLVRASTPAATATRSCTCTTWSCTGSCGNATALGGRWTRRRCTSTAGARRRSRHW